MQVRMLTFGGRWRVLYVRFIQIVLFLIAAILLPEQLELAMSWLFLIPLFLVQSALYRITNARVSEDAIEYKQWFMWKRLEWNDVERIIQNPYTDQVVIRIANRNVFSRFLLLGKPSSSITAVAAIDQGARRFNTFITR